MITTLAVGIVIGILATVAGYHGHRYYQRRQVQQMPFQNRIEWVSRQVEDLMQFYVFKADAGAVGVQLGMNVKDPHGELLAELREASEQGSKDVGDGRKVLVEDLRRTNDVTDDDFPWW